MQLLLHLGHDLENRPFAFIPGLEHHAAETRGGKGDLKGEIGLRDAHEGIVGRGRIEAVLVQGGVGRRIKDAEDDPLVLGGCQFPCRHGEHRKGQQDKDDPDRIDGRAGV